MNIKASLKQIQQRIFNAEQHYQRETGSVWLLAVSKQHSISEIQDAIAAGQHRFAENYVQEALPKITALRSFSLEWHFIGTIQSNKTRLIAENFDWVQSVNSVKIAQRLNQQRPEQLSKLNICIEVNIDQHATKSGVEVDRLIELALAVNAMERLNLRGLMVIPQPSDNYAEQRAIYQEVYTLQQQLCTQHELRLDTLSMGMSNDFVAAIAAGSTMVRIGTAIFGVRV